MSCSFDNDNDNDNGRDRDRDRDRECSFIGILESLDDLSRRELCVLLERIEQILRCRRFF